MISTRPGAFRRSRRPPSSLSSPRRRPCGEKARDIEEVVGDRHLVVGRKPAHGFFTRTSWCPYSPAPASGCARTGPVPVLRCAPTRLLLVPRSCATRSYSCARYLAFAPTRRYSFVLARYSSATRSRSALLLACYSCPSRARTRRCPCLCSALTPPNSQSPFLPSPLAMRRCAAGPPCGGGGGGVVC